MAPASWSTSIAHPRIVRVAGRSRVISMAILLRRRIVLSAIRSGC
jgi:hypothetical protein